MFQIRQARAAALAQVGVTVRCARASAAVDLDLFVRRAAGAPRDATTCLVPGDEEVTFTAEAGERFHVVVDGYRGSGGAFTVFLDCLLQ